jgi:hypothetical protein
MAKLHEILAVEGDLEATAKKIINEAISTFSKKAEHFIEMQRDLKMFNDDRSNENTSERKEMVTTVNDKLGYVKTSVSRYFDAFATKEATNQTAKANLVVNGETLLANVPATVLLGLESKLKHLRSMYEAIPTLQPGIKWEKETTRENVYSQVKPEQKFKTEKTLKYKILHEATKEHPAQIETWHADDPVGQITVQHWCGMVSPAEKSKLLRRLDELIRATKQARQRANTEEAVEMNIGDTIFNYINE